MFPNPFELQSFNDFPLASDEIDTVLNDLTNPHQMGDPMSNEFDDLHAIMASLCSVSFLTRKGKNSQYVVSNHSPEYVHCSRRIEIKMPVIGFPYTIQVVLSCHENGIPVSPVIPSISDNQGKKNTKPTFDISFYSEGMGEEAFTPYLHVLPTDTPKAKHINVRYQMDIYFIPTFSPEEYKILHQFSFTPLKSHKFESSDKGKLQNSTNANEMITIL